jgi:hypothetical protein
MPGHKYQPWSAGQPPSSVPRNSQMSYSSAQPRPSLSARRPSRVHFEDIAGDSVDQTSPPAREDPYNPRWQNAIYDNSADNEEAPIDDYHRPSAATLVGDTGDLQPPLDHLGEFLNKKPGTSSFSNGDGFTGVSPPSWTYAPGRTPSVSSRKKKESRTILERRRRASISTFQVKREETPEEAAHRLEKEKRRGLPANHRELYGLPDPRKLKQDEEDPQAAAPPILRPQRPQRATSDDFDTDILLDRRDPRFTGRITLDAVLDRDEIELERLKKMTFAQRMSEKEKDKIRFHIVCELSSSDQCFHLAYAYAIL